MRILLSGYNGQMGRVIQDLVEVSCGYSNTVSEASFPVYTNLKDVEETVDIIIDFSSPLALEEILNFAVKCKIPVLIASTGLEAHHFAMIDKASESIAVLQSGNYSMGVHVLKDITKRVAKVLQDWDVEIIEKHHNLKVDAPSGTALLLRDAVVEGNASLSHTIYGRSGTDAKRVADEIGIHAVRGGSIVGEHTVIFAGLDEVIELKHTAYSKKIFAKGALDAAKVLVHFKPGRYSMEDVIHD